MENDKMKRRINEKIKKYTKLNKEISEENFLIENILEQKEGSINYKKILSSLNFEINDEKIFDNEFSGFYKYEDNKITCLSNNYPFCRIKKIFKYENSFMKFKISSYGWFGVCCLDVPNNIFPGDTLKGWMICTDGRICNNGKPIWDLKFNIVGKIVTFYFIHPNIIIKFENNDFTAVINTFPRVYYLGFSLSHNSNVELLDCGILK
jgi:hypothetical protein